MVLPSGKYEYLTINEWGWVGYEELSRSRMVLSQYCGRRPRWITPSEIFLILHILRKPNSLIVLWFIQNISYFKNIAKTCLPASMLSSSLIVTFRFVQLRKYSPNSRCRLPSCLLTVFAMFLVIISPSSSCSSYSWNEWNGRHFFFTSKTSQPRSQAFSVDGALTCRRLHFWRHFLV